MTEEFKDGESKSDMVGHQTGFSLWDVLHAFTG